MGGWYTFVQTYLPFVSGVAALLRGGSRPHAAQHQHHPDSVHRRREVSLHLLAPALQRHHVQVEEHPHRHLLVSEMIINSCLT